MKKIFFRNKFERSGLTMIELIVSLSVIVFVMAIFVGNYRGTNKRTDLIMTAQNLVANIHYAQKNSLGLTEYGVEVPAGGWGVSFSLNDKNNYVIFADLQGPGEFGYTQYDSASEGIVTQGARMIELPPDIEISALRDYAGTTKTSANVTFLPPNPQTNIVFTPSSTSTALEIDLIELRSETIKTVKVNFLGLVEVIN